MDLAIERRKQATAQVDPRVAVVGFRRPDSVLVAVIVNHAMHPVALGASNTRIRAEVPGQICTLLAGGAGEQQTIHEEHVGSKHP